MMYTVEKPPFEECYPELERLIQTHQWRQQLPGYEVEDIAQEMRIMAYKAWQRWDPERAPLKVMWWSYWVNWRMSQKVYITRPKRSGMRVVSFDTPIGEAGDSTLLDVLDPTTNAADPQDEVPCPTEVLVYRQYWWLMQMGYKPAEVSVLLGLEIKQVEILRRHVREGSIDTAPDFRRVSAPGRLGDETTSHPRVCKRCETPIIDRAPNAMYCSRSCMQIVRKARRRELQRSSATVV